MKTYFVIGNHKIDISKDLEKYSSIENFLFSSRIEVIKDNGDFNKKICFVDFDNNSGACFLLNPNL